MIIDKQKEGPVMVFDCGMLTKQGGETFPRKIYLIYASQDSRTWKTVTVGWAFQAGHGPCAHSATKGHVEPFDWKYAERRFTRQVSESKA